jgi:hypothetical protein
MCLLLNTALDAAKALLAGNKAKSSTGQPIACP